MNIAFNERTKPAAISTQRRSIRIVIVGHVDHGKSTLIGRLLHETGSLPAGKLETLKAVAARRGMSFEWSFLLDALQTERDQGITIDTSQIRFRTPSCDVLLIDAPGHAEFLRNMITGAAQADAAILIVDVVEGIREQTRRHAYLLHLLGIRQVLVVVNKMDRIDYSAARFEALKGDILDYLAGLGLNPTAIVPISARHGEGISQRSESLAWYQGPTVLEALDEFEAHPIAAELPLRLPVQAVYKFDDKRILAGRIESGMIVAGDHVAIEPGGKLAQVKSIEDWPVSNAARRANAGRSIGITLDREIFVERGSLIAPQAAPPLSGHRLRARIFWLGQTPLEVDSDIIARVGTAESRGSVTAIVNSIDPGSLSGVGRNVIEQNHVGEIEITLSRPLAGDPYAANPGTGRLVIELDGRIAGGGLILSLGGDLSIGSKPTEARNRKIATRPSRETLHAELESKVARLAPLLRGLSPVKRLRKLRDEVTGRIVFTTSFGLEDQVILQMLVESGIDVDLVTLDTGRLFPQTYDLWAESEARFGRRIKAIYPQQEEVAALVERQGINGFYESREARLACCHVRKVKPLNSALTGAAGWITGLRAEQSAGRGDMALVSADAGYQLIKLNPLFDWNRDAVLAFADVQDIPRNPLHAKGFASIGCAPCTRAIAPGAPERAGRWWWEDEGKKECGLHGQ